MLTAEAISALLRAEEGETLALKERFGADVIETAVAFANIHGGTILMGVRDYAHITGERWGKEALRDYVNRISTATEPAVVPARLPRSTGRRRSGGPANQRRPPQTRGQPRHCEERSDEAIQQRPWQGPPWIVAQRLQRQQPQEACSRTLGWYRTALKPYAKLASIPVNKSGMSY